MIDRHFRPILIELALRRIRPAENIVERYVKIVRILHENVIGRERVAPLIAENCRLINILYCAANFACDRCTSSRSAFSRSPTIDLSI